MFNIQGFLKVQDFDKKTGELVREHEYKNLVVVTGKNLLLSFLKGDTVQGIKHIALGTGTATPAASDTKLQVEQFRKVVTGITFKAGANNSTPGEINVICFLETNEANGTWYEAGLFAGDSMDALNTGILFSRVTINETKSADTVKVLNWKITLT